MILSIHRALRSRCPVSIVALGFAGATFSSPDLAAQNAPTASPTARESTLSPPVQLDALIVTGSNIRRVEAETSLPVTVIDQDSMDLRGVSTPAELFDTVTFANPPLLTEQESAGQSARGDNTSLDLRGLGSGSTLVLVNGRRMPPHPISQSENGTPALSVNANTVPSALATRVEILRDGASAIYGSDAAAGVVNYILAPRFDGFRTTFRTAMTLEGGANENRAGFLWGDSKLQGGKTSVLLGVDFFHRDALVPGDRWWAQNADQRRIRKLPAPWNGLPVTLPDGTIVRDNDFDNSSGTNPFGTYTRGTVAADLSVNGSRPTGNAGIVTTQPSPFATMTTGGVFFLTPIDTAGTIGFRSSTPSRNFDSPEKDFYQNTNNGSVILPRTDRSNLTASVEHRLNDRLTAFGEFIGYYAKSITGRVGPQIDIADALGISAGVDNPFNPFGSRFYHPTGAPNADGSFRLTGTPSSVALTLVRPNDFPTRVITVKSSSYRGVAGLRGKIWDGWEWEGALSYASAHTRDSENNNIRESKLKQALLNSDPATAFNPFGYTFKIDPTTRLLTIDKPYRNSAPVLSAMGGSYRRDAWTYLGVADLKLNGPIGKFLGNDIGAAVGGEARYEGYKFRMPPYEGLNPPSDPNPFLRPNDNDYILLSPNIPANLHRMVYSAFTEIYLPLVAPHNAVPFVHSADLSAAVRAEHFPFFGNAVKPKVSLGYSPVQWLKIRASFNESFKAPNIIQSGSPRRQVFATGVTDPYRFEVTNFLGDGSTGRTVFRQGAEDLKPEESLTYTAGFVIDVPVVKGLSLTVDFYKINQNNNIANVGATTQLLRDEELLDIATRGALASGTPLGSIDLGSGTAAYKGNPAVRRSTLTQGDRDVYAAFNANPANAGNPRAPVGPVINIEEDFGNLDGRDLDGIEFGATYNVPKSETLGQFTFSGEASYRHKIVVDTFTDGVLNDNLYEDGNPKWRFNASLRWRKGNLSMGWFTSYYGKFVDTSAATTLAVYEALGRPNYINPFNNNGTFRYLLVVGPYIAHNYNVSYRFDRHARYAVLRDTTVRLGVNNVFNVAPPISDSTLGYESGAANPRGQQFWLELSRTW